MIAVATLRALARGDDVAGALLHTCRCSGFGSELYGIEAIADHLRAAPLILDPAAHAVEGPGHAALFGEDSAVFADVRDGAIGRLWVLGGARRAAAEGAVAVPFDPDLAQASGGDAVVAAGQYPALAADAAGRVAALGRAILMASSGRRTRAFAIRAFGTAAAGAALFAVHRLPPPGQGAPGFAFAGARWSGDDDAIVGDPAGAATLASANWRPRIAG